MVAASGTWAQLGLVRTLSLVFTSCHYFMWVLPWLLKPQCSYYSRSRPPPPVFAFIISHSHTLLHLFAKVIQILGSWVSPHSPTLCLRLAHTPLPYGKHSLISLCSCYLSSSSCFLCVSYSQLSQQLGAHTVWPQTIESSKGWVIYREGLQKMWRFKKQTNKKTGATGFQKQAVQFNK